MATTGFQHCAEAMQETVDEHRSDPLQPLFAAGHGKLATMIAPRVAHDSPVVENKSGNRYVINCAPWTNPGSVARGANPPFQQLPGASARQPVCRALRRDTAIAAPASLDTDLHCSFTTGMFPASADRCGSAALCPWRRRFRRFVPWLPCAATAVHASMCRAGTHRRISAVWRRLPTATLANSSTHRDDGIAPAAHPPLLVEASLPAAILQEAPLGFFRQTAGDFATQPHPAKLPTPNA
jgi:hypothetical protein